MKAKVMIVASLMCVSAWAKDVNVRDFGAMGDGATKDTAAIQRAVDACSAAGGGAVRFEGGRFLTGMFFLKDGVTLRIEADATILGSPDYADYPTNVPLKHLVNEKCPPESFPEKYQQKGAAYWFDPTKPQTLAGVKGVRFDGCTFEEE